MTNPLPPASGSTSDALPGSPHPPDPAPPRAVTAGPTPERRPGPSAPPRNVRATPDSLVERYLHVRRFTESLAAHLAPEDQVVQSMEDVSPTKWHLAHTSWFWETFLLQPRLEGYRPLDPRYAYLFNSYYVQAGERHCRAQRGYISRPTVAQVGSYRRHVDDAMEVLLSSWDGGLAAELEYLVELGLSHEQQHQELLLTDIKHVFSVNPLRPSFREEAPPALSRDGAGGSGPGAEGGTERRGAPGWLEFSGGLHWSGHDGTGFAFDNEGPRHRVYLEPFALADRLVTCGEFLAFMEDGGYERPELWLSEGWATVQERGWTEPFYWEQRDGRWTVFTLDGLKAVDPREPVSHLSYFEADAFARWAGCRLPTEAEWEVAVGDRAVEGNLVETGRLHPAPAPRTGDGLRQMWGDVWEWTRSQYSPYPGYRPAEGAVGEYNGKFMCNQFVLRGGSCLSSQTHLRPTYRNFFPPDACWQVTGLRLARDLG
jgi:ergothioneine biosynthesis protein EgtB